MTMRTRFPFGIISILLVLFLLRAGKAADLYVAAGGSATAPYDTWAKAATDIQTPLGMAGAGDTVWVSNGVYGGSMGVAGGCTNVVVVPAGVALRGAGDPQLTTIQGGTLKRPVHLSGSNTVVDGFTITGGFVTNFQGGGVFCASNALLVNCRVHNNAAAEGGGGYVENASVSNCDMLYNMAILYGGGIYSAGAFVDSCLVESNFTTTYSGGGIYGWEFDDVDYFGGRIRNTKVRNNVSAGNGGGLSGRYVEIDGCIIAGNRTPSGSFDGGGLNITFSNSVAQNTLIVSNFAGRNGGGLFGTDSPRIRNCTILANTAGSRGGGTTVQNGGTFENTIIYGNQDLLGQENYYGFFTPEATYTYCCLTPLTNGMGNISQIPLADEATGELPAYSPCVDAGTNRPWMAGATDVEGDPRVFNETVDIGADETFVQGQSISVGGLTTVDWRVPKGAHYQWQTTSDPDGGWTDFGLAQTATAANVTLLDYSGLPTNYYRVIWTK